MHLLEKQHCLLFPLISTNTLYCRGLMTVQESIRSHLLKCWQRVLALCMSTPALPRVGRGQPEPEAVVRPQRWDGTGSALFTGVPTKNSWRVQSSPLKMFLSSLQPAANPRSCSAEVTSHNFYYCLPVTEKTCRLQPYSGPAPHAPWAGPGTGSRREKTAEKRQETGET